MFQWMPLAGTSLAPPGRPRAGGKARRQSTPGRTLPRAGPSTPDLAVSAVRRRQPGQLVHVALASLNRGRVNGSRLRLLIACRLIRVAKLVEQTSQVRVSHSISPVLRRRTAEKRLWPNTQLPSCPSIEQAPGRPRAGGAALTTAPEAKTPRCESDAKSPTKSFQLFIWRIRAIVRVSVFSAFSMA